MTMLTVVKIMAFYERVLGTSTSGKARGISVARLFFDLLQFFFLLLARNRQDLPRTRFEIDRRNFDLIILMHVNATRF